MDFLSQLAGGLQAALNGVPLMPNFEQTYKCFPIACSGKDNLEESNKVILPPSALDTLSRLNIEYPMFFTVTNTANNLHTHCGVLEFSAPESVAYIPYWMMQNLLIQNESMIAFRLAKLPKGTFVKLQPHETKFTELSNPRAVLEKALRMYACLTVGETFTIRHDASTFYIDVVETKPGNAISIIDTDVNVEFEPPKDFKETNNTTNTNTSSTSNTEASHFSYDDEQDQTSKSTQQPQQTITPTRKTSYFDNLGDGQRLNGQAMAGSPHTQTPSSSISSATSVSRPRMTTVVQGQWRFFYQVDPKTKQRKLVKREPVSSKSSSSPFSGSGHSMQ